MKKIMAVYDEDPFYAERLSDYVNRKEKGIFKAQAFTSKERLEDMMMNTGLFTKDLGTILVGVEAVNEGIINEVGGLKEAMNMLNKMINKKNKKN